MQSVLHKLVHALNDSKPVRSVGVVGREVDGKQEERTKKNCSEEESEGERERRRERAKERERVRERESEGERE